MSEIHVQQIRGYLEREIVPHIDLSDQQNAAAESKEKCALTRALAALAILNLSSIPPNRAAECVTDGQHDNGIDSLYFDENEKILYLVQSKWRSDGRGSLDLGEARAVVAGFRDLIANQLQRFNARIQEKSGDIKKALWDAQSKFVLVIIYTGQDALSPEVHRVFEDLLRDMNDTSELLSLRIMRQGDVHRIVSLGGEAAPIVLDVGLTEWGHVTVPFQAYYGQVAAAEIVNWYKDHYPQLFAPNLRVFLGDTEVNESLAATLNDAPEKFWYFNNGITALCGSIAKKPIHGDSREVGVFECRDFSIVNGAQTVGAIATAANLNPEALNRARVSVRLISLQHCPEGFAGEVTRATNTQNRIERRDFVAQDREQERLRVELAIEHVSYVVKSGDVVNSREAGFDLTEATVALACSRDDVTIAVQAKREISKLWEDIQRPPYRALFNGALNGRRLWRLVQLQRTIDQVLERIEKERAGREQLVVIHGNRFIAHQVFKLLPLADLDRDELDLGPLHAKAAALTADTTDAVVDGVAHSFPESYPGALFKNAHKCREISERLGPAPPASQGSLAL